MGFLSTFQTQLEWWVRMTGGILGIIVAIITLWNLLKPKK
jgi:heme A synthase